MSYVDADGTYVHSDDNETNKEKGEIKYANTSTK